MCDNCESDLIADDIVRLTYPNWRYADFPISHKAWDLYRDTIARLEVPCFIFCNEEGIEVLSLCEQCFKKKEAP